MYYAAATALDWGTLILLFAVGRGCWEVPAAESDPAGQQSGAGQLG